MADRDHRQQGSCQLPVTGLAWVPLCIVTSFIVQGLQLMKPGPFRALIFFIFICFLLQDPKLILNYLKKVNFDQIIILGLFLDWLGLKYLFFKSEVTELGLNTVASFSAFLICMMAILKLCESIFTASFTSENFNCFHWSTFLQVVLWNLINFRGQI